MSQHLQAKAPQDSLASICKLLAQIQVDLSLAQSFSQLFTRQAFQLGDILTQYTPFDSSGNPLQEPDWGSLYLVDQGRVRLLGVDSAQQREVSTLVIEAGGTFGADVLVPGLTLPYQAVAASSGEILQVSLVRLRSWLEQFPNLQTYLIQQAQQQQCCIFLKTSTALRSLPSHQIRQLVPYLEGVQIPANSSLAETTPAAAGHFWLRHGQVQSQQNSSRLPVMGDSWGYPDSFPATWSAATDLWVYKLPVEHWETATAIAPVLATSPDQGSQNITSKANNAAKGQVVRSSRLSRQQPQILTHSIDRIALPEADPAIASQHTDNPVGADQSQTASNLINFPKPSPQRWGRKFWQKYPFIHQQSSSDCGAACLAMIGRYWGKSYSLNFLRNLAGVGRTGASLKGLATAAERLGFQARPVRASLNRLKDMNPWIAHWQGDHYIVVYRVKGNKVLIADPALGQRSLSLETFTASWTGYALLLDPTENLHQSEGDKQTLSRFWNILWPHRSLVLQIILASLLIQVFGLITPLFTQVILDRVVVQRSFTTLHVFSLGLLLFGVWRIGLTTLRQYLLDYFSNRLDLTLISGFISHTLMLPLQFFEQRQVGDLITRVQENQKIQLFLTRQAISVWLDALMVFVYLGLMAYYNWQLTLLVIGLIPPIVILVLVATPFMRRVSREIFNQAAAENSSLVEMLTGISTVKAAAAEQDLRWRWEDRLTHTLNARFRGQNLGNTLQATSGLINTIGSTALLWYGATLVIQDQLTIGQFVAFNMLIGNVISPILALAQLWDELQEVIVSVERLNDVFSAKPEETSQNPMLVLPRLRGEVKFQNVTFRYNQEEGHNTLQNISFEVHAGQTIAIVGRSGSGKSTLMNLLQGLYYPKSGRIWVDGHDIQHISPQSLRSQLGVVPQECFLFSGTILENITLYRPEFTLEQAIEVAKLAEAHSFIQDLPLGYNAKVGERGTMLSGGQRQRIAIARALLGDPRILILDEATSSLDTESERRFQQNLARISRDRTTFIIAHRLSTVRHADCILVLDRGILVERGTHEELITQQGLYYQLAQQQLDL